MSPAERITNAITWYRRAAHRIPHEPFVLATSPKHGQIRPAVVVTDPAQFQADLERWIQHAEAGSLSPALTENLLPA